ncbi:MULTISPECIES: enoyl-CoA hydratase/isomerase family protein [Arsenicicoccus]|uniref:enoyl-CoA hydratase/isomerase family protein n=1 Tax=Arsenicicoccus TaxID=267408 RepID=UPI00257AFE50|nr:MULTISPECIES: enoyl-CoA hydratase/isomerase family protein [Actinomycetes]
MSDATAPTHVSVNDLGHGAADLELAPGGRPLAPVVVVDLGDRTGAEPEAVQHAVSRLARAHVPVVGWSTGPLPRSLEPVARAVDLTLCPSASTSASASAPPPWVVAVEDPEAALGSLVDAVRTHPVTATILCQTLRLTSSLSVADGLAAESLAYSSLLASGDFLRWRSATPRRPVAATVDPVRVARHGDVLRVVLDRPDRRNAYSAAIRDGLVEALDLAAWDETITEVHLAGSGPTFCSGGDLDEFGTMDDVSVAHLIRLRQGAGAAVARVAARVTAHLHGPCIGAGIEVPAFAGSVLASPGTTFRLPELRMGLIPGAGGTVSIPRRIGRWRTAYLALSGAPIGIETAQAWGLVDGLDGPVDRTG